MGYAHRSAQAMLEAVIGAGMGAPGPASALLRDTFDRDATELA